jgi:hypothetical protein
MLGHITMCTRTAPPHPAAEFVALLAFFAHTPHNPTYLHMTYLVPAYPYIVCWGADAGETPASQQTVFVDMCVLEHLGTFTMLDLRAAPLVQVLNQSWPDACFDLYAGREDGALRQ